MECISTPRKNTAACDSLSNIHNVKDLTTGSGFRHQRDNTFRQVTLAVSRRVALIHASNYFASEILRSPDKRVDIFWRRFQITQLPRNMASHIRGNLAGLMRS